MSSPHCDPSSTSSSWPPTWTTVFVPKHTKQYAKIGEAIKEAITSYAKDVREGSVPTADQSFEMDESALTELQTNEDDIPGSDIELPDYLSLPVLPPR